MSLLNAGDPDETSVVVLTEDDIALLSVVEDTEWGLPFRTINGSDQEDVRRAADRGVRSLKLRGMLDDDAVLDRSLDTVRGVAGSKPALFFSGVDEDDNVSLSCPWLTAWSPFDGTVVALVMPDGTYYFQSTTPDELCRSVVEEFIAAEMRVGILTRDGRGARNGGFVRDGENFEAIQFSQGDRALDQRTSGLESLGTVLRGLLEA